MVDGGVGSKRTRDASSTRNASLSRDQMGVHPFSTYVLRKYYKATGWNEDNFYSNLTRSSDGTHFIFLLTQRNQDKTPRSSSRLYGTQGPPIQHLESSQCTLSYFVFYECPPFTEWLSRIYIFYVRTGPEELWECTFQGCCRAVQSAWDTQEARGEGRGVAWWGACRLSRCTSQDVSVVNLR